MHFRASLAPWFALVLGATGACNGRIGVDAPLGAAPPAMSPPGAPQIAPARLRRLANAEYNNAVHDLLGTSMTPAVAFGADIVGIDGFVDESAASVVDVDHYGQAALALAIEAEPTLSAQAGCTGDEDATCAPRFVAQFGQRAFRRPLTDAQQAALVGVYTTSRGTLHASQSRALRLVVQTMLQSPAFLYRSELAPGTGPDAPLDGWALASRLSFALWRTMPDAELFRAAQAGELATPDGLEHQARRLLADPRAAQGVAAFHEYWLDLPRVRAAQKSTLLYPGFDDATRSALADGIAALASYVILQADGRFETLLTAPYGFVNVDTAPYYGLLGVGGRALQRVALDPTQRAGLLTSVGFLAADADPAQDSPVLRGKFVWTRLLCQPLAPPPSNLVIIPPAADPTSPTRVRFEQHSTDPACAACHQHMDPIGFAFEHYDAAGVWRTHEGSYTIDSTTALRGTGDADGPIADALELARRLSRSYTARRCVATQWFRYAMDRAERDAEPSLDAAFQAFVASDFNLRELIVGLVRSDAFRARPSATTASM